MKPKKHSKSLQSLQILTISKHKPPSVANSLRKLQLFNIFRRERNKKKPLGRVGLRPFFFKAPTPVTGGLGSPRSYPNQAPPHYPTNPLQSIPPSSMMYPNQQDASPYNCYEPQPQQPTLTGYERRASAPSAQQHLQPGK